MSDTNSTDRLQGAHIYNSLNLHSTLDNDDLPMYKQQGHLCQYYEIDEFQEKVKNITKSFSTLSLNVRSLTGKLSEFKELITNLNHNNFKFTVIGIQEVWHIPEHLNTNLPGYKSPVFKLRDSKNKNRNNIGGGIGFWVREGYEYEILNDISIFEEKIFESLFIRVKTGRKDFKIIGNIYRPPGSNFGQFNDKLEDLLKQLSINPVLKKATEIILLGDFNINLLQHETHIDTSNYLNILLENGQLPLITLPSRITVNSSTLLDHINSNAKQNFFDSGLIYSCLSDHLPVFNISEAESIATKPQYKQVRKINQQTKTIFNNNLREMNWDEVIYQTVPESAFELFESKLKNCYEECFPLVTVKINNNKSDSEPWITKAILISRKTKNKLAAKKIKKPSVDNTNKFKDYNKLYRSVCRKAKATYYKDKFTEYSKNMKKTWSTLRDIYGSKKVKPEIPNMFLDNGRVYSGDKDIAEGFNNFFVNIGPNLAKKISESKTKFTEFLSNPVDEMFTFANVTPDTIFETLNHIKTKSSAGTDNISSKLLKEIMPNIINPLVYLFNLSLKTGFVPDSYKCAKIIPIYKSEESTQFTNYRPISLLSSFSKLLEKIIARQMFRYLDKFKILYSHQYGFRPKHDTNMPLIQFLDKIYAGFNANRAEYTLGIFLDLKKAFDTVDHSILLKKLEHYGFKGITNYWFKNYLSNRTQCVSVRDTISTCKVISCGVPQGSVLGPLLFLLYINDLPNATLFFTSLFADDTGLLMSSPDLEFLIANANIELEKAACWFQVNKLTLNVSKTKYIVFRKKSMPLDVNMCKLKIGNELIDRIGLNCKDKYFKFVGVRLDEYLTWDYHIDHVSKKLSSANFALNCVKNILPLQIRKLVYNTLVKSHMEYGIIAWGGCKNSKVQKLFRVQKKIIRNLANDDFVAHTDPLFAKLGVLKFDDCLQLNATTFIYKYFNNKLPNSFTNMFEPLAEPNRTRGLKLERTKYKGLETFPKVFLPKLWNSTPIEIKLSVSTKSFKKNLTIRLLNLYRQFSCNISNCYSCNQ